VDLVLAVLRRVCVAGLDGAAAEKRGYGAATLWLVIDNLSSGFDSLGNILTTCEHFRR
jgi:hypothetical protein